MNSKVLDTIKIKILTIDRAKVRMKITIKSQ